MPGGLTELYENRQMANYRDALRVAARILRISKQKDLPVSDKMFLATDIMNPGFRTKKWLLLSWIAGRIEPERSQLYEEKRIHAR